MEYGIQITPVTMAMKKSARRRSKLHAGYWL